MGEPETPTTLETNCSKTLIELCLTLEGRVRTEQELLSQTALASHGREIGDNYEFKPPEAYLTLTL